jgi:hypothetical protein
MKKFLGLASALALGLYAQDASALTHTLTINASVAAGCTMTAPTGTTGITTSGNSSTFATQVTGTTQAPASGTLTFGNISCTTNGIRVGLQSAKIGLYVGAVDSLAKRMNYVATAKLGTATVTTLATSQQIASQTGQVTLPSSGTPSLAIEISFPGTVSELIPNGALTAGVYTDTLTINIDGVTI